MHNNSLLFLKRIFKIQEFIKKPLWNELYFYEKNTILYN